MKSCPIGCVPVVCFFCNTYVSEEGRGFIECTLEACWVGTPQVGQRFSNEEADMSIYGSWVVEKIEMSHNGFGVMQLAVSFATLDLSQSRDIKDGPSKAHFERCAEAFARNGFDVNRVCWFAAPEGEPEHLPTPVRHNAPPSASDIDTTVLTNIASVINGAINKAVQSLVQKPFAPEPCRYCGGDCPYGDGNYCDAYNGDIHNLYGMHDDDDDFDDDDFDHIPDEAGLCMCDHCIDERAAKAKAEAKAEAETAAAVAAALAAERKRLDPGVN